MTLEEDLAVIARQEEQLQFAAFDENDAFHLGTIIREEANKHGFAVAIDIRLTGRPLFFCAMPKTAPDNIEWVRRKSNTCLRFLRSSYGVGRSMAARGSTMSVERGIDPRDFAPQGGAFPITLKGTGVVGVVTVSGVPERDDHMLVVRSLCRYLKVKLTGLELGPEEKA